MNKPKKNHPWRVWVPKEKKEEFNPVRHIPPRDRMGIK